MNLSVSVSQKVLLGNAPQYLSQMESNLYKIVSECKYWSPGLINNVHGCAHACSACACAHAQCVKICMQHINHHISAKWSWIFMKIGTIFARVSRIHPKKSQHTMCSHVHETHVKMLACFYNW